MISLARIMLVFLLCIDFLICIEPSFAQTPLVFIRSSSKPIEPKEFLSTLRSFRGSGLIETRHDIGGSRFVLETDRKAYGLPYFGALNDNTRNELMKLVDSKADVTVLGIVQDFDSQKKTAGAIDGQFDDQSNISVFDAADTRATQAASPTSTVAAARQMTCAGKLIYGSMDSAIGDCTILMNSKAADKVFDVCHGGNYCRVEASVNGEYNVIEKVFAVSKK